MREEGAKRDATAMGGDTARPTNVLLNSALLDAYNATMPELSSSSPFFTAAAKSPIPSASTAVWGGGGSGASTSGARAAPASDTSTADASVPPSTTVVRSTSRRMAAAERKRRGGRGRRVVREGRGTARRTHSHDSLGLRMKHQRPFTTTRDSVCKKRDVGALRKHP